MKKITVIAAVLFLHMQVFAEITSTLFTGLYAGAGARAAGMAGVSSAVTEDVSSVFLNPAGLGEIIRPEIAISHEMWLMDSSLNRFGAALPLPAGTVGAEILYMSHGIFETADSNGTVLEGTLSPYDMSFAVSYGISAVKNLYTGISLKMISRNDGIGDKSYFLADAGIKYNDSFFSAAFCLSNFGFAEEYSLPYKIRAGAGLVFDLDEAYRLLIAADGSYMFENGIQAAVGAEFSMTNFIFIRGGYVFREDMAIMGGLAGVTAGVGLHFENFEAEYAYVPYGNLGISHRMEIKLKIGPDPMRSVRIKRLPGVQAISREELKKLYDIAFSYEAKNELAMAEEAYLHLLKFAPEHAEGLKRLGAVYVKQKRTTEAVKTFERYLKIKPGDAAVERWLRNNRPW